MTPWSATSVAKIDLSDWAVRRHLGESWTAITTAVSPFQSSPRTRLHFALLLWDGHYHEQTISLIIRRLHGQLLTQLGRSEVTLTGQTSTKRFSLNTVSFSYCPSIDKWHHVINVTNGNSLWLITPQLTVWQYRLHNIPDIGLLRKRSNLSWHLEDTFMPAYRFISIHQDSSHWFVSTISLLITLNT